VTAPATGDWKRPRAAFQGRTRAIADSGGDALFSGHASTRDSDERYTPAWVFTALGETFDLDPASPLRGGDHVPTSSRYTVVDDGLTKPWHGFVWVNPPFSNATAWARRFQAHGNGLWLGPVANSAWFSELGNAADRVWVMRDFPFVHPTHAGRRSSMPLGMIAIGSRATAAIDRAARLLGPPAGVLLGPV
jgi:hypothetical protein